MQALILPSSHESLTGDKYDKTRQLVLALALTAAAAAALAAAFAAAAATEQPQQLRTRSDMKEIEKTISSPSTATSGLT